MQDRLATASLKVYLVPCLQDNYAWILQDVRTGHIAILDTPAAKPIIKKIQEIGLPPDQKPIILNTHHHRDHTGGNLQIKEALGATVFGPKNDHIIGIDRQLVEGDTVQIGMSSCRVLDLPGHTKGHIGYVFDDPGLVFVGDTLFSHGCGALFEGSFSQMWKSLSKIAELPSNYLVFCAHEYTEFNLLYARQVFRDDAEIEAVYNHVRGLREIGEPTVPSLLEQELATNPFLRCRSRRYQDILGKASALEAFTCLREGKDMWGRGSQI
jgi:hydroxyacylglutathione hydrolase